MRAVDPSSPKLSGRKLMRGKKKKWRLVKMCREVRALLDASIASHGYQSKSPARQVALTYTGAAFVFSGLCFTFPLLFWRFSQLPEIMKYLLGYRLFYYIP